MSISVHILFFGFTVGFDIHEEFAGSGPDSFTGNSAGNFAGNFAAGFSAPARLGATPALTGSPPDPTGGNLKPNSFGTTMQPSDWDRYCTSFALLGV
jgi:hypothetical protein